MIGLPVSRAPDSQRIRDLYSGQYTLRYRLVRDVISDVNHGVNKDVIQILRIWHGKEDKPGL
ncbi:hypothetical protein NBRC116585_18550 [Thalassolituus maritimus]|uniref:Plasmid stabilization system n=1 Tax=Thalassolituus maritimus TaxID=484498 RepID=A0ABQ0A004_9GAMM